MPKRIVAAGAGFNWQPEDEKLFFHYQSVFHYQSSVHSSPREIEINATAVKRKENLILYDPLWILCHNISG